MENIIIRRITAGEVADAMAPALEVFMQFEAPDYPPEVKQRKSLKLS